MGKYHDGKEESQRKVSPDVFSDSISSVQPLSPRETAMALLESPGKFSSPLSFVDNMLLWFFAKTGFFDFFKVKSLSASGDSRPFVPYSWQVLMRYLYREGVLRAPGMKQRILASEAPKSFICEFFSESFDVGDSKKQNVSSLGNALDIETALSKGIGEMLERFFLSRPKSTISITTGTLKKESKKFLDPESISHFSLDQRKRFPRFQFDGDTVFDWVCGEDLFSGEEMYIPAQSVFLHYHLKGREGLLREINTNGSAGHFTREKAILSGIYELVERDGVLIYWLNSLSPAVIDIRASKDHRLTSLVELFGQYNLELCFLDTTTDIGIPAIACVLIDRSEGSSRVAVGGGCGWDVVSIMIEIAYKTLASLKNIRLHSLSYSLRPDYVPFSDQNLKIDERVLLWQNPKMFPKIEFFLSGPKKTLEDLYSHRIKEFKTVSEEYHYTLELFRQLGKGYEISVYEAKDTVLTAVGYHVVKVFIPEMVPLYLRESFAPLGALRLRDVPRKMGYNSTEEWNPLPHPYP